MNWFWIILFTSFSVIAATCLCFYLLRKTDDTPAMTWVLQQISCPILRILVLMIIVSLIYPGVHAQAIGTDFWRVISQQGHFNQLLNILFFGSLALSFVPILNHPVFALPIQGCLAIALAFNWQYAASLSEPVVYLPSNAMLIGMTLYMMLAYLITRTASPTISRWVDRQLSISGSIRLVSDAIYLPLQIPILLLYSAMLSAQVG